MQENHQLEQYFFAPPTIQQLADLVGRFPQPCCLGAPTVHTALRQRGVASRLLDVDPRLVGGVGAAHWDMFRPTPRPEAYGAILCDPPFNRVRLSQLFTALRVLVRGDPTVPVMLCHLARRSADIQGTLGWFGLRPTDIILEYVSVHPRPENRIILYTNITL